MTGGDGEAAEEPALRDGPLLAQTLDPALLAIEDEGERFKFDVEHRAEDMDVHK